MTANKTERKLDLAEIRERLDRLNSCETRCGDEKTPCACAAFLDRDVDALLEEIERLHHVEQNAKQVHATIRMWLAEPEGAKPLPEVFLRMLLGMNAPLTEADIKWAEGRME